MRWFRFYDGAINDPKVQRLPAETFRAWVNLLCVASAHDGHLPENMGDLAYEWRCDEKTAKAQLETLIKAGLVDRDETLHPHNWNGRQYKSDSSSNRVKAFRERQTERPCNVSGNVSVTANETAPDTDTEQNREEPPVVPPVSKPKRKARVQRPIEQFDPHRQPDEQDLAYAAKRNTPVDPEWGKFANYCIANNVTSADFHANWRTWCDNDFKWAQERAGRGQRGGSRQGPPSVTGAFIKAASRHPSDGGLRDDRIPGEGADSGRDESGMGAVVIDAECTVNETTGGAGSVSMPEPDGLSPEGGDGSGRNGPGTDGRADGIPPGCGQDGSAEMGAAREMVAHAGGDSGGLPQALPDQAIAGGGDGLDIPGFLRRF